VQSGVGWSRRNFSEGGTCLAVASAKADLSRRSFSGGGGVLANPIVIPVLAYARINSGGNLVK